MTKGETQSSESIWTRQFIVPTALARFATILYRVLIGLAAVIAVLSLALFLYYRVTLGPGARLELTDAVSIRVPSHFSAFALDESGPTAALKSYAVHDSRDECAGLVAVDA